MPKAIEITKENLHYLITTVDRKDLEWFAGAYRYWSSPHVAETAGKRYLVKDHYSPNINLTGWAICSEVEVINKKYDIVSEY